ncbi:shikimate kinase [Paenibacillus hamazuiensis]|uniref:shikimate kinase n=1 Tax=Paenibacillus hamazuiensis TaxID=2936508 RepID=UPI00200E6811|nr:shikimate kinase [Paenibacillus hamazuiensis]
MMAKNIVLIGMAGTGKSTVGQALAAALGWEWVDTDQEIEREQGMPISQIFAERGEPEFRAIETDMIRRMLDGEKRVVSTGGGAVLAEANRRAMTEGGLVIALKAPAEVIIERVRSDSSRPLFQGNVEERVRTLAEQRKHAYDFAHVAVDTSAYTVEQIVRHIKDRL